MPHAEDELELVIDQVRLSHQSFDASAGQPKTLANSALEPTSWSGYTKIPVGS